MNRFLLAGLCLPLLGSASALAADLPSRKGLAALPPPAAAMCKETEATALPTDVFGFSSGSDVAALGTAGLGIEYNGNYGARFNSLRGHLGKAQLGFSPLPCLEIGPSIIASYSRSDFKPWIGGGSAEIGAIGGGLEFKYKVLGRATHGVGLTFSAEPTASRFSISNGGGNGWAVGTAFKALADGALVRDRLYGAVNLIYTPAWAGDGSYSRTSSLSFSTALAYKALDSFFVGAEAQHVRTWSGNYANAYSGQATYVGPTLFWQATSALSVSGTWAVQVAGDGKGDPGSLNLATANRHLAKVKAGYSF